MICLDSYEAFVQIPAEQSAGITTSLDDADYKILWSFVKNDESFQLLKGKGVYPYEYMSSLKTQDDTQLPFIQSFYSPLKQGGISEKEYSKPQKVCCYFKGSTLQNYHGLFLFANVVNLN